MAEVVLRGDKQCPHGHTARRKCDTCDREDDQKEIARLKTACRLLWHFGQPTEPSLRAEIIALAEIGDAPPSELHP